jgi:hypothetical protein
MGARDARGYHVRGRGSDEKANPAPTLSRSRVRVFVRVLVFVRVRVLVLVLVLVRVADRDPAPSETRDRARARARKRLRTRGRRRGRGRDGGTGDWPCVPTSGHVASSELRHQRVASSRHVADGGELQSLVRGPDRRRRTVLSPLFKYIIASQRSALGEFNADVTGSDDLGGGISAVEQL